MTCPSCGAVNPQGSTVCSGCGLPLASILTGQTIADRYRVLDLLGRGGMGVVYRATDTMVGEEIALKVLHPGRKGDRLGLERFRQELLTARRVAHPNVIRIHDMGAVGEELFISMELLSGGTLADRLEKGPLPVAEAVEIAIAIAEGLEAAHAQGIVHRDLKPDNVLFDGSGRAKLSDFGLARLVDATLSSTGFSGTPFYMSPEQADGAEHTPSSDIYSLGVVLFELFTGRLPFQADTLLRLAVQHAKEAPPRPRSLRPEIPAAVEQVILACLEKDPARRPASGGEVAEGLKAAGPVARRPSPSRTLSLEAPPPGPARQGGKGRGRWALLAVGLVSLGGLIAVALVRPFSSPREPTPAPPVSLIAAPTPMESKGGSPPPTPVHPPEHSPPGKKPSRLALAPTPLRVAPSSPPAPATPSLGNPVAPRPTATGPLPAAAHLKVGADRGVWANVSVDGNPVGETPWNGELPSGRHVLGFENPESGLKRNVRLDLPPSAGSLAHVEFKIVKTAAGGLDVERIQ